MGQIEPVDGNVSLSVAAVAPVASPTLPSVTSGALRLWLRADNGVTTNASGQVSLWQDQSGNANDASQANTNLQPSLIDAPSIGGKPVLQFNGIQDGVQGSYLSGSGDVSVPNALTAFTVYSVAAVNYDNNANHMWMVGATGNLGGGRDASFINGDLAFGTFGIDYQTPYVGPFNAYRICTDRVNTNVSAVEIFDATSDSSTNFSYPMSSAQTPAPKYYVGGLDPSAPFTEPDNFDGDIGEIIIYRGYLTDADRLSVLNYLEEKYYQIGTTNGLTYQWQLDSTNIASATNSTLILSNVQLTASGTYRVVVHDTDGSTTSSNAVVTVGLAPSVSSQPASQEVGQGANASFTVGATGDGLISYQWFLNPYFPNKLHKQVLVTYNKAA